jgi:hypothetical protein
MEHEERAATVEALLAFEDRIDRNKYKIRRIGELLLCIFATIGGVVWAGSGLLMFLIDRYWSLLEALHR